MNPLETYLREIRDIRSTGAGTPEPSYYAPLANLFNEIGKALKPKVRCIINLGNRGAGLPDGGFFTPDQFPKSSHEPLEGQIPSRGVIEVKGTADDAWVNAEGEQVTRYWGRYRQVFVTNLRDFILVGQDAEGKPAKLETYRLAESESAFWASATNPRKMAELHGDRFSEYLKRVMLHAAPLAAPEDLAWFLASYARDAKARLETAELPGLAVVRGALEEALGLKFEGEKGDHFFRSTLVQTLFYGIFSAWVLWAKQNPPGSKALFNWHETPWHLRVPVIRALFEQMASPSTLRPLALVEVLDWAGAALNRVDRPSFFDRFQEEHAVQYFYEPFLKAFDPELRKELGVWYTPPEIVQYMVSRIDTVLREELGLPDGLADPNVYVLDPCCGTGAYLVEVLKRIHQTLQEKRGDALVPGDVKRIAMERVFGFEILPAPFVVSHLQLGLLLQALGAPLAEGDRAGVYLTNALTGWDRRDQTPLPWPELEAERDSAGAVKQNKPILVILGNPPYNAFAGTSPDQEEGLVEPYKGVYFAAKPVKKRPIKTRKGRKQDKKPMESPLVKRYRLSDPVSARGWGIKKFNLDDLYVRFFRLAERRIAEKTGRGVVSFISNFSYLSDPSFVIMRQRFLSEFDKGWFDCLNGDSRETGKLTPDGKPDPSVFSTEHNREGIRIGTAIGLLVRAGATTGTAPVHFRQFWGAAKRADLLESLKTPDVNANYELANPGPANRYSFRPSFVTASYLTWPAPVDLCAEAPISGLQEMRRGALMDIDRGALGERMRMYCDPRVDWPTLKGLNIGLTKDGGRYDAKACRSKVLANEKFNTEQIHRYALYPFDNRWCYHSNVRPLWNEPRPALAAQSWPGNRFFVTRMFAERPHEQVPMIVTPALPDYHLLRPNTVAIPVGLRPTAVTRDPAQIPLLHTEAAPKPNLSAAALAYLGTLGITTTGAGPEIAELIWMHALAIGYSPRYLSENADGIRQDWPRIPLPDGKDALLRSAGLGKQIAALLDTEKPVSGVTSATLRPELRVVAVISRFGGGSLDTGAGDLAVTARWGHRGKDGVVMPGKGRAVERAYQSAELGVIEQGAIAAGLSLDEALAQLGETTFDIYLNNSAYWSNVPARVWSYTIGGYQVVKKWLSYREFGLLGRPLTPDEAREVRDMARRIAAILLLQPQLGANYIAVKDNTYPWTDSR